MEAIDKYKSPIIWLSISFILCLILLGGCKSFSQASSKILPPLIIPEPPLSKTKCPKVKIWKIALLEWNKPVPLKVVEELQPYPGGAYTNAAAPGPKHKPTRPYLRTYVSSGGIVGNLQQGDSKDMLIAVRLDNKPKLIPLTESPARLSARKDGGIWINFNGPLVQYDAQGKQIRSLENLGGDMMSADDDAVWVIDFEKTASFVSADGQVKGPYPWDGFNRSSVQGQNLCIIADDKPGLIKCLKPNGQLSSTDFASPDQISGGIVKLTDKILVSATSNIFSYYDTTKGESHVEIENAGLTTTGEAFINLPVDENWSEVCISDGTSRWVPIKYDSRHLKDTRRLLLPKMTVVAVDGDRTLTFVYDRAIWWRGNQMEKSLILDENSYRQNVFPYEWLFNPTKLQPLNADDGTVIMSVTGPKGIALIGLRWNF